MRTAIAAFILTALLAAPAAAQAAPKTVNVRIEGATETLFEGPVRTEGHEIEPTSEIVARACDGTNGGKHATPGATPTAAAVDAMSLVGESFSGTWFSGFDDYLIERWGPETSAHWGLVVDETFTSVGGCQIELEEGDRVLWAYDGTKANVHYLTLAAGSAAPSAAVATATVAIGEPLTVTVDSYAGEEGMHTTPQPVDGAKVSPVDTEEHTDFQTVDTASAETVETEAAGKTQVKFAAPGWHRLKATASGALVSNRLDVCVPASGASSCGALPDDDQVRAALPETTQEPASVQVVEGAAATFEAAAAGVPAPSVQWEESLDGGAFSVLSGATSDVLKIIGTKVDESGDAYRATFTNAAGKSQSTAALLTVTPEPAPPVVIRQPADVTVPEGTEAVFEAEASGTPEPTVQWEEASEGGPFEPVAGATADTIRVRLATLSESGDEYRATFANPLDSVLTRAAKLTVTHEASSEPGGEPLPVPQSPLTAAPSPAAVGVLGSTSGVTGTPRSPAGSLRLDGLLLSPFDDRATAIHYHGHWRKLGEGEAWQGTVTIGGAGASLSVRLAAGRPVLIVRDVHRRARIAVIAGTRRETFTLAASSATVSRTVIAARRKTAGTVQVRVLSGTIGIDGVAVTS